MASSFKPIGIQQISKVLASLLQLKGTSAVTGEMENTNGVPAGLTRRLPSLLGGRLAWSGQGPGAEHRWERAGGVFASSKQFARLTPDLYKEEDIQSILQQ